MLRVRVYMCTTCKNASDVDKCAYYILIEAISSASEYSPIDSGAVVGGVN